MEPLVGEGYNHGWCTRLAGASTMDRRLGFLFVALAAVIHGSLGVISKGLLNVAATNGCVSSSASQADAVDAAPFSAE